MKEKNIFLTTGIIVAMILSSMAQHVFAEPKDIAVARTLFQQRCNTAGEKITRTVEDVDGLLLLKIRSRNINYRQQFVLDDPYGETLPEMAILKVFSGRTMNCLAILSAQKGGSLLLRGRLAICMWTPVTLRMGNVIATQGSSSNQV